MRHKNRTILTGPRNKKNGLWIIHLDYKHSTSEGEKYKINSQSINSKGATSKGDYESNNAHQENKIKDIIQYLHSAAFRLPK